MAYKNFAYWYDTFNGAANHTRLTEKLVSILRKHGISNGLVVDLGCGTGEITLRLAAAGYNMIAVDASPDMLGVLRDKMAAKRVSGILLLCQNLTRLDLYGTVRAAVSTFDTLNHLTKEQLETAFQRIALFVEPEGLFLFDANTPYKHETILADQSFPIQNGAARCNWQNEYDPATAATKITVTVTEAEKRQCTETFMEYAYPLAFWEDLLHRNGFLMLDAIDGERFAPLQQDSQRYLITAQKVALNNPYSV